MNKTKIVAHRGSLSKALENTIEAFQIAFSEEADFVEGDFWLTGDNEIVCIHDQNTFRITSGEFKLDVKKSTLKELKNLRLKTKEFTQSFTIPELEEVLNIIPEGCGLFLEIKDNRKEFVDVLKRKLLNSNFPLQNLRIISFHPEILKSTKQILPEIKTYWLFDSLYVREKCKNAVTFRRFIQTIRMINCDGIDVNISSNLNNKFVQKIKDENLELGVYDVNDEKSIREMLQLGVDYITTDFPGLVKSIQTNFLSKDFS
jgi:glycerophosphoryl diester phosphodiesterase